jgi:hypothetical protein
MTRCIPLVAVFILVGLPALAQLDTANVKKKRLLIGFMSGSNNIAGDFSNMNAIIGPAGYPTLKSTFSAFRVGITSRREGNSSYGYVRYSMVNYGSYLQSNHAANKETTFKGWEVDFGATINLVKSQKWILGPYYNIGGGVVHITLLDSINKVPTFPAMVGYLHYPLEKKLSATYFFIALGGTIERRLRISSYDFYLGLGAGYRLAGDSGFAPDNIYYTDTPNVNLGGVEFNFLIRFERWREFSWSGKK